MALVFDNISKKWYLITQQFFPNMKKKKSKISKSFLLAFFAVFAVLGFLIYKEQIKVTVVNSFSETFADDSSYHVIDINERKLDSLNELAAENQKVIVFVTSSWCSLCDVIANEFKNSTDQYANIVFYEIDLDQFRSLLIDYRVNAPAVIMLQDGRSKVFNDVNLNNLEQILVSEV